jgi:hypothetical protein
MFNEGADDLGQHRPQSKFFPVFKVSNIVGPVNKTEISVRGNSLRSPRNTLYPQRLTLTSPTSGGCSVVIVRLRTTATEFNIVGFKRTMNC